jgi:hypothetical protein
MERHHSQCWSVNGYDIFSTLKFLDLLTLYNNHFSISNLGTILCALSLLCSGPVLCITGPVTSSNGPVTNYTCPVPTNLVAYRKVYYRYYLVLHHGSTCWLVYITNTPPIGETFRPSSRACTLLVVSWFYYRARRTWGSTLMTSIEYAKIWILYCSIPLIRSSNLGQMEKFHAVGQKLYTKIYYWSIQRNS